MHQKSATRLAFGLCMITTAVNLQAPLYGLLAAQGGVGVGATTVAFACYVAGVMPVLLGLNGLADRVGYKAVVVFALLLNMLATLIMLIAPDVVVLGVARFILGVGTALASAVAPAYMHALWKGESKSAATSYVTISSALGFGLGAAATSVCIFQSPSLTPPSLWLYLCVSTVALTGVITLNDAVPVAPSGKMLRLPSFPTGAICFGLAILIAWAAVGLVIAILPSALSLHGLGAWSGFAVFGICSCGVLFQPWARRLSPYRATRLGLMILPPAYGLIAWGALVGNLPTLLLGTLAASSACYGFIYLGGLSGVLALAGTSATQASAGYLLMAYIGFSLPVVCTGVLIDRLGYSAALMLFGSVLLVEVLMTICLLAQLRLYAFRRGPTSGGMVTLFSPHTNKE
ncbi:MFS transporter [Vreelandella aquamarina]